MNGVFANGAAAGQAPKRSNSGREIVYIQQNRLVGSGQPVQDAYVSHQPAPHVNPPQIPADVAEVFNTTFRKYTFRDLYRWLKMDRQEELGRYSTQFVPAGTEHVQGHLSRPSIASSRNSRTSSVFSIPTGYERNSFASSRSAYSMMSDLSSDAESIMSSNQMMGSVSLDPSSALMNRNGAAGRNNALANAKQAAKQRENDLEVKKRYFCTACNKGFARKYDWKVHEQRYHEQQFQYPCPDCNQILYAETHFRSHHRDAHGCQQCTHAKEVTKEVDARRRRTAWGCGFCSELLDDWEKRCDHISQHYDEGQKRSEWDHSKVIIGLLRQPDIDSAWQALLISKHGHHPNPPLQLRFSKEVTARSHGDNLQLQDMLELGAIDREVDTIVNLAYDQGVRNAPPPSQEGSKSLDAVKEEQEVTATPSTDVPQDSVMGSPSVDQSSSATTQQSSSSFFVSSPMDFSSQAQTPHRSPIPVETPSIQQIFNFGGFQESLYQDSNFLTTHGMPSYDKALPPIPVDNEAELLQSQTNGHSQAGYEHWPMLAASGYTNDASGLVITSYDPNGHY